MPDDRLFHKRLGHSEKVGKLTDLEYIVWGAYILSADDFGVMRFSAIPLQADHDRLARKPQKIIQRALNVVLDVKLIVTFEDQGHTYCAQHDWQNHQHVKHPRQTINPIPPADLLGTFSTKTRDLFSEWPGKKKEGVRKDSGNPPEGLNYLAGAGGREEANGLRQTAHGSEGGQGETATPHKVAFDGSRLRVWTWQHDDLARRLGTKDFDLLGWYPALNDELERTGESYADPWKWLQERLYRDAKLPLPNLMGRHKLAPSGPAYKPYVPFRDREPVDS